MLNLDSSNDHSAERLFASRQSGYALGREFYTDDTLYQLEIDRIWRTSWLMVGHTCEIANAGDYFTVQLDCDEIILIRDDEGEINAMYNVCRHRGMKLCGETSGHIGRIVCPYHQWTYARDGRLQSCRGMHEEIDHDQLGLNKVHVREMAGLIYISLAADPPAFEQAYESIAPHLTRQGLQQAKVAKTVDYLVKANWKLIWENNRECYHCNVNHPQYIKANYDHYNEDDTPQRVQQIIADQSARSEEKWASSGLAITHQSSGMTCFPDAENEIWYSLNRTPLAAGYISETMAGNQVAPLMGDYQEADVGTLRIRTVPNFWNHSSCDHSVSTSLMPVDREHTKIRVTWLVHEDAVEGEDYELAEIMPFWQLTSEQDWDICEKVQQGVISKGYQPGPLSTFKEYNVERFFNWYIKAAMNSK